MSTEQKEQLQAKTLIATSLEISKSLPKYNGKCDNDQFNMQLAQFVEISKTDLKTLIGMLLLVLRGQALTFLKKTKAG